MLPLYQYQCYFTFKFTIQKTKLTYERVEQIIAIKDSSANKKLAHKMLWTKGDDPHHKVFSL